MTTQTLTAEAIDEIERVYCGVYSDNARIKEVCALAKLALSASAGGVEEPDDEYNIHHWIEYSRKLRASLGAAQGERDELKTYKACTVLALKQVYAMFNPPLVGTVGVKVEITKLRNQLTAALSAQAAAEAEVGKYKKLYISSLADIKRLHAANNEHLNGVRAAEQRAASMEAEARRLRISGRHASLALEKISDWRNGARAYDLDMDNAPRDFCEDVELIEASALSAMQELDAAISQPHGEAND